MRSMRAPHPHSVFSLPPPAGIPPLLFSFPLAARLVAARTVSRMHAAQFAAKG